MHKIIKTLAGLTELLDYLKDKEFVAFDTETTGVDKESKIIGFSVCTDIDLAYYVILSYWDVATQSLIELETTQGTKEVIQALVGKKLIMQNAPFDCFMVKNVFRIDLMPSVHTDTLVLGHLLNENRSNGLKERGVELFGEDARKEQIEMKESVSKNGGVLTKKKYELYKADSDLIAKYGAQDATLTLKVFYHDVEKLIEEKLDGFFYDDESMPLLKGPTYDLNTTGLRVDTSKIKKLQGELEAELMEQKAYIYKEIEPYVKDKYPATSKKNTFNIGSGKQLAWLLFINLDNEFDILTKAGKELCKALEIKIPYAPGEKRRFVQYVTSQKGSIYEAAKYNPKTKKMGRPKKVGDPWNYLGAGKASLGHLSKKYKWVATLLAYAKNLKLLNTYVIGIQDRIQYGIIRPSFLQHGTTSGRYSSKNPNFQNLPRDDKRIKSCIIAREGKIFVGADYAQLEPRVFASVSKDPSLLQCFKSGDDFYSVVGAPIFDKTNLPLKKDQPGSFAKLHPDLRDKSKVIGLATPYGRTARQQASVMGISSEESQSLIDRYFNAYPLVESMMLDSHKMAMNNGVVYNLYGRPRRIPEAINIPKIYGDTAHKDLPYQARTLLNLAMNHRVQSTGASIMNRAAIAVWKIIAEMALEDPLWTEVKIILQVHDELILEGPIALKDAMIVVLKHSMENTVILPGVDLIAEPKAAYNLADLK